MNRMGLAQADCAEDMAERMSAARVSLIRAKADLLEAESDTQRRQGCGGRLAAVEVLRTRLAIARADLAEMEAEHSGLVGAKGVRPWGASSLSVLPA